MVWEIDHPDTQAWKRAALRRAGLAEPANVQFVAADLSADTIGDLGIPARATWNWLEGVPGMPIAAGHGGGRHAAEPDDAAVATVAIPGLVAAFAGRRLGP